MNGDYYIDMSVDNSYDMLQIDESMNIGTKQNIYPLNEYNKDNKLIEGMGQFGRVNLQKCCPVNYMWSDKLKKCVKICDSCGVSAYGKINYEFLHWHGDDFFTFTTCEGDASGSYDYDKINKRYDKSELLNQYDMNMYIDGDPDTDGVQPAEEDPWSEFSSYFDPEKGTSPGKRAAEIEAEHKRRRDIDESDGFFQTLEILDKNMYYIKSEVDAISRGAGKWPNIQNPYGTSNHPKPGSWKMQNLSEWSSSGGEVKPIMYSLGTEFIPNKIIDPLDISQTDENRALLTNLIQEMANDAPCEDCGPVYDYYKAYLDEYDESNAGTQIRERLKEKRAGFCSNIQILTDLELQYVAESPNMPEVATGADQMSSFYDNYCGENQDANWTSTCKASEGMNDSKKLLCEKIKYPHIHFSLTELCEGVENLSPCST